MIDERIRRIASLANVAVYDEMGHQKQAVASPHIKHASLRKLYGSLVVRVFDRARAFTPVPRVLDLGAGEGSVTRPFLELGAKVTAVDISSGQLERLRTNCAMFEDRLEIRCQDVNEMLTDHSAMYDIIVMNSFLHHIPDYVGMLQQASEIVAPHGQFFSFQDPLRYDTMGAWNRTFSQGVYFAWRLKGKDVFGGLKRHLRRKVLKRYVEESHHDNAEYHVVRNGVDQEAIRDFFETHGFDCEIVRYFSTHGSLFQPVGSVLGVKNTFAVIAMRRS